jgi:hypothetical protein
MIAVSNVCWRSFGILSCTSPAQHIAVMAPPLVYPILVLQACGAAPHNAYGFALPDADPKESVQQSVSNVVSLSFVVLGIGTMPSCRSLFNLLSHRTWSSV